MARLGNTNAMKNGRRCARPGTVLQRLGPRFSQAYKDVCRMRREVERLLGATHGGVSFMAGARLQSALRIELCCRIAENTIKNTPDMSPAELRSHRESISRWTRERDGLLEKLLDGKHGAVAGGDPWEALDQARLQGAAHNASCAQPGVADGQGGPEAVQEAGDAQDAILGDVGGTQQ